MLVEQKTWTHLGGWIHRRGSLEDQPAHFVLAFGGRAVLENPARYDEIRAFYPGARLLLASTSGEITDVEVTENQLTLVAVALQASHCAAATLAIISRGESHALGAQLARQLAAPDIAHVFVLADGGLTDGTELARGLSEQLPPGVLITGGLAGDGTRFEKTLVGLDAPPTTQRVAALAIYGTRFKSSFGSCGGWSPFGPERVVTKSEGNHLHELDGRSALGLYRQYLGPQASGLPGTGLRFPLSVSLPGSHVNLVRTVLSVDQIAQTMTFGGDIPAGARVRFMHASYEDLLDGAANAADQVWNREHHLVICISCVGRRIVLGQRTEEEIEIVRTCLGAKPVIAGFYSYGELAPAGHDTGCQLHNQTMTITAFSEE